MKLLAALFVLLALLAPSRDSRAEGSKGSFELWVHQGLATQSLKDWNDEYDTINQGLAFFGVQGDVNTFGNSIPYGAELGYRLTPGMSLAVGYTHQSALTENGFVDHVGFLIEDVPSTFESRDEITFDKISAILGLEIGRTGLTLWGELGYGFSKAESFVSITPNATPSSPVVYGTSTWDGNAMVGSVALGLRRELGGRSMIRARVGYQMADMGELEGPAGPPLNFMGVPKGTDFSGIHISGAIGIILTNVR